MNDIRKYIDILETALQDELQKYRDELRYWQNEHKKYWPVSPELLAQYKDGTPTHKDYDGVLWLNQNDKLHRDGDKPAVIGANGSLVWYQNGQMHRDGDKPAVIYTDGDLYWYQNDEIHRFRGPAIIHPNGTHVWYWRGEYISVNSQEEFIEYLKKHKGLQRFRMNK